MIYEDGYRSAWRLNGVSKATWSDGASIGHVASANVTSSIDSDAPSIDSADVELSAASPAVGSYVRLWMDARQSGALARVPIVTGRVAPSTSEVMGMLRTKSDISVESVLKPAEDADPLVGVGVGVRSGEDAEKLHRRNEEEGRRQAQIHGSPAVFCSFKEHRQGKGHQRDLVHPDIIGQVRDRGGRTEKAAGPPSGPEMETVEYRADRCGPREESPPVRHHPGGADRTGQHQEPDRQGHVHVAPQLQHPV